MSFLLSNIWVRQLTCLQFIWSEKIRKCNGERESEITDVRVESGDQHQRLVQKSIYCISVCHNTFYTVLGETYTRVTWKHNLHEFNNQIIKTTTPESSHFSTCTYCTPTTWHEYCQLKFILRLLQTPVKTCCNSTEKENVQKKRYLRDELSGEH